jgi:5'-3' exonuclease
LTNLIIDASHLLRRIAHTSQGSLTDSKGRPSGLAHGFFMSLAFLAKDYKKQATAYVAFDSGVSELRKALNENYKCGREDVTADDYDGPDLSTAKNYLYGMLQLAGIPAFMKDGLEADDIITALTVNLKKCIIISSDKDFLQLISDDVNMFDPIKKAFYNPKEEAEKRGYDFDCWREQFIFHSAIIGDKDEVPQLVPGIGEVRALPVAKALSYGCRHDSKYADAIHEHLDQLEINLRLFDLQWAFKQLQSQTRELLASFKPTGFTGIELESQFITALKKWELQKVTQRVGDILSLRLETPFDVIF